MKNKLIFSLKNKIELNIKGNNITRLIKRLKNNNIEIIKIKYISDKEVNIKILSIDYDKVIKLKTVYEVSVINQEGIISFFNNILNNKFMIIFILIFMIIIYILSNMIFSIDIITNEEKMYNKLILELKNYGIEKYKFKKDYNKLQEIKIKILDDFKDELEWIEIESLGTKYIVKYEPRIKNSNEQQENFRNIVALKDAVIYDLNIKSGQIIKNINSYVKKGDVIVSGYITLNDSIKDTVSSKGKVLGKTWYKVNIKYPFNYYEEKETGNSKNVFVIKFLNKEIELFNFNKYKSKRVNNKVLLKNNLLPISFSYQKEKELEIIKEKNNKKNILKKAVMYALDKIKSNLNKDEDVLNYKVLNYQYNKEYISADIFFELVEDITSYQDIEKYEDIVE